MNLNQYDGSELIMALAKELKTIPECAMPEWALFVKTGVSKTRTPMDDDWWYIRSASILRKVGIIGPIGVNKLKRKYGSKYRRGYKPAIFQKGSGKIIRVALQQLEKSGLIKQVVVSGHKGRVLDKKANALLAKVGKTLVAVKEVPKIKEEPKVKEELKVKETKSKATKEESAKTEESVSKESKTQAVVED